jgi:hypothetical protein
MKPFTALISSTLLGVSALSACGQPTVQVPNATPAQVSQQNQNTSVIDLKKGRGSMRITLNAQQTEDFAIKANTDGKTAKTNSAVSNLEIFLFDIDSGVRPTAGTLASPLNLQAESGITNVSSSIISFTGSTQTVLLTNIPANSNASGRFFIGVRALESTENITDPGTGFSYGTGLNFQLALSGSGGDTAQPGGVSVSASYVVSDETALGVSVPLKNAIGATLDAQVSVTNGSTSIPGISIQ